MTTAENMAPLPFGTPVIIDQGQPYQQFGTILAGPSTPKAMEWHRDLQDASPNYIVDIGTDHVCMPVSRITVARIDDRPAPPPDDCRPIVQTFTMDTGPVEMSLESGERALVTLTANDPDSKTAALYELRARIENPILGEWQPTGYGLQKHKAGADTDWRGMYADGWRGTQKDKGKIEAVSDAAVIVCGWLNAHPEITAEAGVRWWAREVVDAHLKVKGLRQQLAIAETDLTRVWEHYDGLRATVDPNRASFDPNPTVDPNPKTDPNLTPTP